VAGEKGGVTRRVSIWGAPLPCRPPSNLQPSLRAAAHHLIRLDDLRVVPRKILTGYGTPTLSLGWNGS
jgi:hypothetical protein